MKILYPRIIIDNSVVKYLILPSRICGTELLIYCGEWLVKLLCSMFIVQPIDGKLNFDTFLYVLFIMVYDQAVWLFVGLC